MRPFYSPNANYDGQAKYNYIRDEVRGLEKTLFTGQPTLDTPDENLALSNYKLDLLVKVATKGGDYTQDVDPLKDLGVNNRYRGAIMLAGFLTDLPGRDFMPRQAVADVINLEAAKGPGGLWNPQSFNDTSKAYGLTQFTKPTWLGQARKSGTFLNQYGQMLGGGENNTQTFLDLRANPVLSIVAAAQLDAQEFGTLTRNRVITDPAKLSVQDVTWFMYLGHHEGSRASQTYMGTLPQQISEKRLNDNLPDKGGQPNPVKAFYLNMTDNNTVEAYRQWLFDYANNQIYGTTMRYKR